MELLTRILITIGISSPIIVGISVFIFYFLKYFIERKFEFLQERAIKKIENDYEMQSIKFQHNLTIELDQIKNIQDKRKEILTEILTEFNSFISDSYNKYNYEESIIPLLDDKRLQEMKGKIYANGLYLNSIALELISAFFVLGTNNSTWIYDALGHQNDLVCNKFELSLMKFILNELFFIFRQDIGIMEKFKNDYSKECLVLTDLLTIKDMIKTPEIKQTLSPLMAVSEVINNLFENKHIKQLIMEEFTERKDILLSNISIESRERIIKYFNL